MVFNTLEDKCKYYQSLVNYKLIPNSYILCHIDGRAFSKYCKRFEKPYDDKFITMMNNTAQYLCSKVSGCKLGYTQSDEITLVITNFENPISDTWFEYRINKMCSIIASMASTKFLQQVIADIVSTPCSQSDIIQMINNLKLIEFDCKVWNVPSYNEVFAWLLFRQNDCIRNSKQMLAQTYFSHKALECKNTDEQIQMVLDEFNIDWNSFDDGKKFGRFILKKEVDIETVNGIVKRNKWVIENAYQLSENKKLFDNSKIIPKLEYIN